ncbi:hypothetical protein ACO2Q0_15935 [Phenylobacterium sp. VNQ135]|uniref:hypothetical protein n=1 Tax=Phenylobacterium sp. VNQ135 TaxID=3400922 RepID=UPI003C0A618A
MTRAAAVLLAALAATPAAAEVRSQVTADGALRLWAGERVTVRFDADGRPELVSVVPAPESDVLPPKPGQGKFDDPPQGVAIFLVGRERDRLWLKTESGLARAFDLRAQLLSGPAARPDMRPVSACTILPLLTDYQDWPASGAAGVQLYEVRMRDTNAVTCTNPARHPGAK